RRWHGELIPLETEARTNLQIELDPTRPMRIEWVADNEPEQGLTVEPGRLQALKAVHSFRIHVAASGVIQVRSGARELAELLDKIEKKRDEIDGALAIFGVSARELPDGFDRLEELRIRGERAEQRVDQASADLQQAEAQLGSATMLREKATRAE